MFVRAKIDWGAIGNGILVPQRAVGRDPRAAPSSGGVARPKVAQKTVKPERAVGESGW